METVEMLRGTQIRAGLGVSTVLPDMDFETYSEAGYYWDDVKQKWLSPAGSLKKGLTAVGLQVYAEHPTTEILCLAYDLKDGCGKKLWIPGGSLPEDLLNYVRQGGIIEAFNAPFEERIWNEVAVKKHGFPPIDYRNMRCAQAKSRAFNMPNSLAKLGDALNLLELKDPEGKRLLNKFSVPRKPTKKDKRTRIHPLEDLADGARLYNYCVRDILVESKASQKLPDLIPSELEYFYVDWECNIAGVKIDESAIHACISYLEDRYTRGQAELEQLTEGQVTSPTQTQRICRWLSENGAPTTSISAENVDALLGSEIPENCKKVLKIRQQLGSAAVKKLYSMRTQMSAKGRVHDMFLYHGARTGRDSGRGIQPQNFPRAGADTAVCKKCNLYMSNDKESCVVCGSETHLVEWGEQAAEQMIQNFKNQESEKYFSEPMDYIVGVLRGLLVADEGCDFICSDYSAIEAVVAACLAGEKWRIEVFKNKGDIYLESISRITGTPVSEYTKYYQETGQKHPHRQIGKVAELASGYGGWVGSWVSFGADKFLNSEEEIKKSILSWRDSSPAIVEAWGGQSRGYGYNKTPCLYGLEGCFIKSVLRPRERHYWREGVYFINDGNATYCVLPSGRAITYHAACLQADPKREGQYKIMFKGWNSNPKMGAMGWVWLDTYGGRLFENVVQAVARDIMAHAAVNLNRRGYKVRLRIHDELGTVVPEGFGSVQEMESIANDLPVWAKDWPIRVAGGWRGKRYKK